MALSKEQQKSILIIRNYLNVDANPKFTDDYILTTYSLAVDELVENASEIKSLKSIGIKSKSDGVQSITFTDSIEAWTITPSVKMLLPLPYARMMGVT